MRCISAGVTCSHSNRQRQLPEAVPGVFMRWPGPSISTSCIGSMTRRVTEANAARSSGCGMGSPG